MLQQWHELNIIVQIVWHCSRKVEINLAKVPVQTHTNSLRTLSSTPELWCTAINSTNVYYCSHKHSHTIRTQFEIENNHISRDSITYQFNYIVYLEFQKCQRFAPNVKSNMNTAGASTSPNSLSAESVLISSPHSPHHASLIPAFCWKVYAQYVRRMCAVHYVNVITSTRESWQALTHTYWHTYTSYLVPPPAYTISVHIEHTCV